MKTPDPPEVRALVLKRRRLWETGRYLPSQIEGLTDQIHEARKSVKGLKVAEGKG